MWFAGLPLEMLPLWQLAQALGVMPAWLNLAPVKVAVLWQVSQACCVGTCFCGLTTLAMARGAVPAWQLAQSRGVPLKTPLMWQDSQRTLV